MAASIDLTETQIVTVLGNYLTGILPAIPIFRGQANRVSEPSNTDFLAMWPTLRNRLATNVDTWSYVADPTAIASETDMQVTVQCDVHGPNSAENAQIVFILFRDDNAWVYFSGSGFNLSPLYASDPRQLPFLNAEAQYEERWTLDVVMQANPVVSATQDFANTLTVTLEQAD